MRKIFKYITLSISIFVYQLNNAQTPIKINNGSSSDCKGKLTDSETNQVNTTYYSSNERITFRVCISGASSIVFKFSGKFEIENNNDFLRVHKGRDTFGSLVGKFTGNVRPSGSFTVSDSCITFYFHSDKNYNLEGFELSWEAKITQVPIPKFSNISDPPCNSNKIRVTLDQKFNCDSIKAKNFKLSGTLSTAISSVTPINCDGQNMTNTFDISFASGLNQSGNYILDFNSTFKDRCDSIWKINAKLNFKITDCPIKVLLSSNYYTICKGSCARITAVITGGNPANYTYNWISGGLSGAPPKTVCPTTDTRYILEVSDGNSVPGKDTIDIVVVDPPIAQNDTTICQSSPAFTLKALPAGGTWTGSGITNASNGTFNPANSGAGNIKVYYSLGGCRDSVIVTVRAINAGPPNAACPSSAPFNVSNFSPAGGTWSGPNITPAGVITPPSSSGSFVVTYTWNGCTANKTINIDGIVIKQVDTICKSKPLDTLLFSPKGGTWTGPGLTNASLGISNPTNAGAGNKRYIYIINGCRDTTERFIRDIDARWDEIACPDAGQRTLPAGLPTGGVWSGKGIFDPVLGIFDADSFRVPGKTTNAQVTLTYTSNNGCKDDKIMYLRYTRFYKDTVKNCLYDTAYFMRWQYVQNDPWNMMFTGTGIVGSSLYNQKFSPKLAGSGFHLIEGDGNGCKDSIIIQVYPKARIQKDTTFCIADDPFKLYNGEGKGTFSGKGITNGIQGIFSPTVAGNGTHKILFNLPGKCIDTVKITVTALPVVQLIGIKPFYCYKDTAVKLGLIPSGGILTGPGTSTDTFNPAWAGTGTHTIQYKVGTGKCVNSVRVDTEVGDTLIATLTHNKDSLCIGSSVNLSASVKGGTGTYNYNWSSGQINVSTIFESPKTTTNYILNVSDGCSDVVVKQKSIYVHPKIYGSLVTSPLKCYGERGFAQITMSPAAAKYAYLWNTIPPQTTALINAPVSTTYKVRVTNTVTQCYYDTIATIPGYNKIRAFFTVSPSGQCLYTSNPELQIINLSEGGINGTWNFGDGQTQSYDPLTNPIHTYVPDQENYKVRLRISNEGGCIDSFSLDICFIDTISLFMPDAFTPNDDEVNDVFKVSSFSVVEIDFEIYNRWGEKLFHTNEIGKGWDGKYKGNLCPTDYYIYKITYKGKKTPRKYRKGVFYLIR